MRPLASPYDVVGRLRLPRAGAEDPRRVPGPDGRAARSPRTRRGAAARGGPPLRVRRQAVPRVVLLVGLPGGAAGGGGRGRAAPGLRGPGDAARQRPRPRRLHGRLRHPARAAGHAPPVRLRAPGRRVARGPRAVRRVRGDPARRPAADLVRRAAAPVRVARGPGRGGAPGLRPVPDRGDHGSVPRRFRAGPRSGGRRGRDDGAALQVGQVLHRAAVAHRRHARRRRLRTAP